MVVSVLVMFVSVENGEVVRSCPAMTAVSAWGLIDC